MNKKKNRFLKLKYFREKFNSEQSDFGKLVGVSASQYGKKERGESSWYFDECLILKEYINKRLNDIGEPALTVEELFEKSAIIVNSGKRK